MATKHGFLYINFEESLAYFGAKIKKTGWNLNQGWDWYSRKIRSKSNQMRYKGDLMNINKETRSCHKSSIRIYWAFIYPIIRKANNWRFSKICMYTVSNFLVVFWLHISLSLSSFTLTTFAVLVFCNSCLGLRVELLCKPIL